MHKSLSALMLLAFILAVVFANFFPSIVIESKFLGDSFIRILKAFVPFLIFGTISYSIASFDTLDKAGKIVPLTLSFYILSTLIGISFALIIGSNINFGYVDSSNFSSITLSDSKIDISSSLSVLSLDFTNFTKLILQANPFAIMILSIIFGLLIRFTSRFSRTPLNYLAKINSLVISFTNYIMLLAPIAIFALLGNLLVEVEGEMLISLVRFVLISILVFLSYLFIFYGLIINYIGKLSPISFFKKIKDPLIFAFFSSSSAATMPLTLKTAEKDLNINKEISSFVVPIGVTVNMDGSAIYLGLAALFIGQILGISFTFEEYLIICLTATIGSIGAAGVPSVALVMMTIVFSSVGIPLEAIAIIAGVDRLLDMFRTSINVAGDLTISTIVNRIINK